MDELSEGVTAIETEIADNGGLDQPAMESYMRQLKSIARRNTLPIGRRQVSLEAHASKVTRLRASKLALEDWKESLKKAWEAIKAAFARGKEIVVNFFKALFDRAERVKQKAVKLKAAATAAKGQTNSAAKVKLGSLFSNLAKHLQIDGEVPGGNEILNTYKDSMQVVNAVAETIGDKVPKKMEATIVGITVSVNKSEPVDPAKYLEVLELMAAHVSKSVKSDIEGFGCSISENLLGDKVIQVISSTDNATPEQIKAGTSRAGLSIVDAPKRTEAKEKEIAPVPVADIIGACDLVIATMDNLIKISKSEPSKVGTYYDSLMAKMKGMVGDEAAKAAAEVSRIAALATRHAGSVMTALRGYAVSVSDALVSYLAASLKTLKGGEAAAAPAAT